MSARSLTKVLTMMLGMALGMVAFLLSGCGGGGGAAPDPGPRETLLVVEPVEGSTAGGTWTTLRGSGFQSGELGDFFVFFGENLAFDVTVIDDKTVLCRTPPGRLGPVAVNIIPEGTDEPLLAGGYVYVAAFAYVADGPAAVVPSLRRVDLGTGDTRVVGPVGFSVRALAAESADVLYAAEAAHPFRLIRILTGSGAGTAVALLRDDQTGAPVEIVGLTWLDGRLFGRAADGTLVEVDTGTGLVTSAAPPGGAGAGPALTTGSAAGEVLVGPASKRAQFLSWSALTGYVPYGSPVPLLEIGDLVSMTTSDSVVFGVQQPTGVPSYVNVLRIDPISGSGEIVTALPGSALCISADF